jgi:hypothetical protein
MPINAHQTAAVDDLSRPYGRSSADRTSADSGVLLPDALLRLRRVKAFLDEHGDALQNAVDLIAGGRAAGHVLRLIESAAHAREMTPHIERLLRALHELLTQDNVRLAGSARGHGRFDIAASNFEEIRMLVDHLRDLIDDVAGADGGGSAPPRRAR